MFLPDINLWLALAFKSHFHHASANRWFDGSRSGSFCFCRLTQQGFLRLAFNPEGVQRGCRLVESGLGFVRRHHERSASRIRRRVGKRGIVLASLHTTACFFAKHLE